MVETLLSTLQIVGWLGIVLGILVFINTACGIFFNTNEEGRKFKLSILLKGLGKALIFYGCVALLAIVFSLLPFINEMINNIYGIEFISNDTLNTLSTAAVFGLIISAVLEQGKKALGAIDNLLQVKISKI